MRLVLLVFSLPFLQFVYARISEELFVRPLHSGHVLSHFQFTSTLNLSNKAHYGHFPKAVGEIYEKYQIQELHLSLTQGLWRTADWGYSLTSSPPGAQLWVWFKPGTTGVDQLWKELTNTLSGVFCASLNFMDSKITVSPHMSFRPSGAVPGQLSRNHKLLRYAALPKEIACTENLTPWKKLLPCDDSAGLSEVLDSIKLFDTAHHSLSIQLRHVCLDDTCSSLTLELLLSLSVVFDRIVDHGYKQDWSIKTLFGSPLRSACPIVDRSMVFIDLTSNKTSENKFALTPAPDQLLKCSATSRCDHFYAQYDLFKLTSGLLNIQASYNAGHRYVKTKKPQVLMHRYSTGSGQASGGVATTLYNNHKTETLRGVLLEIVPWYFRLYYHTLRITTNEKDNSPLRIYYLPGRDRVRAYHLEIALDLPPNSVTTVSYEFQKALLYWTEYPPDANHGFYIPSATFTTMLTDPSDIFSSTRQNSSVASSLFDNSGKYFICLHSETLLVSLPTPDFSMPYNVICLVCTVVAIGFGSVHNLTTREFTKLDPAKVKSLKQRCVDFVSKFRKKKPDDSADTKVADASSAQTSADKTNTDTHASTPTEQSDVKTTTN